MGKSFDPEEVEAAREVMGRALRRLNVLEYVILFLAVLLALAGGGLVAWLLSVSLGAPFRWSWAGASLLLFVVPGAAVYLRESHSRRGKGDGPPEGGADDNDSNAKPKGFHG